MRVMEPTLKNWDLIKKGTYFMSCFVSLLRLSDGLVMDAVRLKIHIKKLMWGALVHVVIPIL